MIYINSFARLVAVIKPDSKKWRYINAAFIRGVSNKCLTRDYKKAKQTLYKMVTVYQRNGHKIQKRVSFMNKRVAPLLLKQVMRATGENNYYHIVTDHLGTPKELFHSHEQCRWRSEVTLWLKTYNKIPLDKDKETLCCLRFQGQYKCDKTPLFYNLNQYYDPSSRMYLTNDPVGLERELKPQSYVHNSTTWIEPWGFAPPIEVKDIRYSQNTKSQKLSNGQSIYKL